MKILALAGTAFATSLSVAAAPAHAQSAPGTEEADAAETGDIIVTGLKRSERLQDVPIQVSVITGENIAAQQIKMTADIVRTVPNLTVEKTDTYSNSVIVLRGISQASSGDTPVAVIVDGVPQDDPKQFNARLFDIEQIEVLKGPQGSLYGRKAEAGAIIITTAAPTNELSGFGTVSYSRGDTLEASAGLSGALVPDKIQFRVAGSFFRTDGVIPNTFRGVNADRVPYDWTVRGSLLFTLSDRAKLTLLGQHQEHKAGHNYFAPVFSGDANDFQLPRGNFPNRGNGKSTNVSAKFTYDFDFATLTTISGYTRLREINITDLDLTNPAEQAVTPNSFPFQFANNQPFSNRIFSQEVRLVSESSQRLRWLVSVDYLHAKQFLNSRLFFDRGDPVNDPFNPANLISQGPANVIRSDIGASAQIDYDIADNLTITVGGRYDSDKRKQQNLLTGVERPAKFEAFQPKVSAAYKIDDSKLIYATYSEGFRSGGFNATTYVVPIYLAEELTNYEIGFKSQFFDRALTINGAIFHSIVKNMQDSFVQISTGSRAIANIDRVRINGLELEARVNPTAGLTIYGNLGLTDPIVKKFTDNPAFEGNVVSRGYKLSANGGLDYSYQLDDDKSLFFRADVLHYSKKYWYLSNLDVQRPKTYVNGSIGAKLGDLTVSLWAKNIFGVRAYETFFVGRNTGFPMDIGFPNKPATYGVEVSARF